MTNPSADQSSYGLLVKFIFFGGYLIISILSLYFFVDCVFKEIRFWSTAQEASGKVVGLDARQDNEDDSSTYYPIIRFTTARGQAVTDTSDSGSAVARYAVGEAVRVRYNPANPTQTELPDFFGHWSSILGDGLFALFCCGPLVLYVFRRKNSLLNEMFSTY